MKGSYLDYAMSVIVSRALPDVRDGLKPVHRRIVYAMKENGYDYNKQYRKSARIVGDVMGKYHPHGDAAIYQSMVRMAQNFSMRLPLIDGQGNFGSMDGDSAAAMRYTEARLQKAAHFLIEDIDKDTVDFTPNYDESTKEPSVLPARYPNLLVNGAGGIAVGMATNIPPHNLGEVIDGCFAYIDNPEVDEAELISIIPAPDFPTGGQILGYAGAHTAYMTGHGSVIMRARCSIEEIRKDRDAIIVTEIPYQVNKADMVAKMAGLVRDKKIEGISDIRDESDRHGVRIVIEIKRDFQAEIVLNQLYRFTSLQTSFGMNMLALNDGRPMRMTLKQIIVAFIQFREEVIRRRTIYNLNKARNKAHVLVGLAIAVANLDEVIKLIRNAPDPATAKAELMERNWPAHDVEPLVELIDEPDRKVEDGIYKLSEAQARAILDLKLHRLTGLERDKLHGDLTEIGDQIKEFLSILGSREKLYGILRDELAAIKEEFATPRRSEIIESEFEHDIEDLIQREDMVVTVTDTGYIKRVPLSTYRAQRRGGKGRSGMNTRDEDQVTRVFIANTHTAVLFFSSKGIVYKLKVYKLPSGSPTSLGKAMINILPLEKDETISTIMPLPEKDEDIENMFAMFATASGNVRKSKLSDFIRVQSNGKIAMKLDDGDSLVGVGVCTDKDDVFISTDAGKCIRFPVSSLRIIASRSSTGVRGIRLAGNDKIMSMSTSITHVDFDAQLRDEYLKVASAIRRDDSDGEEIDVSALIKEMEILNEDEYNRLAETEQFILTATDTGFGKRTSAYEYRVTNRGGQGITNIKFGEKSNAVVASFPVTDNDQIMLITDNGKIIRMPVKDIRIAGRQTMGVTLFKTSNGEKVVSAALLEDTDEDEEEENIEVTNETETSTPENEVNGSSDSEGSEE
ncbi:MAG: DNA gyrase subunit A [Alphaproteobacteria bacterium]|nr:DNA gyrase subunit A [Alphaproteobacteria bacterium]